MKKKTKAGKAFLDKIASLTLGAGAKEQPPAWVPKVFGPDGKEMKCVAAGRVRLSRKPKPDPDTSNDDSFAA